MGKGRSHKPKKSFAEKRREKQKKKDEWDNVLHQSYSDIIRENTDFENYYKTQKIVPENEWESFLDTMKKNLPVAFRITSYRGETRLLLKTIKSSLFKEILNTQAKENSENNEETKEILKPISFYPGELAWQLQLTRKDIRRSEAYFKIHNFLIVETDCGGISRQEVVSMVPPLVLDVKPSHKVLDMCAAPGSKTAQLIEMIHSEDGAALPDGFVIANDLDNSRCYMLVHQAKRLNSPIILITNYDASVLPKFTIDKPDGTKEILQFDRILADVPCSGDGTMRKNPDIWCKWSPANGNHLHGIQYRIARRGLELLAVGGRMVYSTCSLNPIENEAVLHRLLLETQDSVKLVDCRDLVPGLVCNPGVTHWMPASKNLQYYETWDDVPEQWQTQIRPQMFPPKPEDAAKFHLERCIRILPHHQDTGGFFVAVLEKVTKLPWERESCTKEDSNSEVQVKKEPADNSNSEVQVKNEPAGNSNSEVQVKNEPAGNSNSKVQVKKESADNSSSEVQVKKTPADNSNSEVQAKKTPADNSNSEVQVNKEPADNSNSEVLVKKEPADNSNSEVQATKEPADNSNSEVEVKKKPADNSNSKAQVKKKPVDNSNSEVQVNKETAGNSNSKEGDNELSLEEASMKSVQGGKRPLKDEDKLREPRRKRKRFRGHKEDPFVFFKDDKEDAWLSIKNFYAISDELDPRCLLVRCLGRKKKNIYYTSPEIRSVVIANEDHIKLINTGVKTFVRCENKNMDCPYRLAQEGIQCIIKYMGDSRKIRVTKDDLILILQNVNPTTPPEIIKLDAGTQERLNTFAVGSCILIYEESETDHPDPLKLQIVGWRGTMSLRAYVPRNDAIHYLRLLGADCSQFEKNKFKENRESMITEVLNSTEIVNIVTETNDNVKKKNEPEL